LRIKPEKIGVNPLYPRSINPYTDVKTAIVSHSELILFGLVDGIVQTDIMRFMRDMRIIQFI